jgi:hypothetical protein
VLIGVAAFGQGGAVLYNGIRLPSVWPPSDTPLSSEPREAPYLLTPPEVIPIDVGRQLFVDHFLIEQTDLRRTFHRPTYYPANPVLKPDKPWERIEGVGKATPFSDGVFWDPQDQLFKAWYRTIDATGYATSRDGVRWEKPVLDVKAGTNLVHVGHRDSATVWLDLEEKDPKRRYKFLWIGGHGVPLNLNYSADGIHWGEVVAKSLPTSDRTTFFRNPFRNVWVFSLRDHDWVPGRPYPDTAPLGRLRRYWEHSDAAEGLKWPKGAPVFWVGADRLDHRRVDLNVLPQLYNLDAVAYESLLVGMFTIWRGQPTDRDKPNELTAGFSRDGFHWDRPDRRAFLPVSEKFGDWNYANVQSAGGVCLVVGDRLYFYMSGRESIRGVRAEGESSMGLAVLRRDGFASMDADGRGGSLTTRPVRFKGRHLFVNVDSTAGELTAEILDEKGRVIEPYSRASSLPVRVDNTLQAVRWRGGADLSSLSGRPVRFRFYLRDASLYSFWVSPDASGASYGYLGAGSPGVPGIIDTVGSDAYRRCCPPLTW